MNRIMVSVLAALVAIVAVLWWQLDHKTESLGRVTEQLETANAKAASLTETLRIQRELAAVAETQSLKGEQDLDQIRTDIAADDTDSRLRQELASVRRSTTHTAANAATQRLADQQTIGVLAHMLESCSGFAGVVAGAFEEARARGLTCQRVYEGVRGVSNER